MDWIKKNTTLVVGMVIALVAVVGAGYYLMTEMAKSAEVTTKLNSAVQRRDGFVNARPPYHPGFDKVDNIKIAREDFKRLDEFKSELTKGFKSTVPVEPTERGFKEALAETMALIAKEGERSGLTTPTNFNMSFTAQKIGYRFASNSLGPLTIQLADLTEVAKILVAARVNSIESFKRVKVSEDDSGDNAIAEEYLGNFAITTNEETKAVIYPYEVAFRGFSEELGDVLEGIATSPYSILVKTISVEPANIRSSVPKLASAASMYEGLLPRPTTQYGPPGSGAGSARGKDAPMTSRYGGAGGRGGDTALNSRYGGAGGTSRGRPAPNQPPGGFPPGFEPPMQPTGPELLLQPEPLKVTLGLAVVHMPEAPAEDSSKN